MFVAKLTTVKMAGKFARSNEEDLELTRAIIMQHISSADDNMMVADDDEQSQTAGASTSSSSGVSADGKGNRQPLKKIKSFGSKMKSKIKSKLDKNE